MKNFINFTLLLGLVFCSGYNIKAQNTSDLENDLTNINNQLIQPGQEFDKAKIIGIGSGLYCYFKIRQIVFLNMAQEKKANQFFPFPNILIGTGCGYFRMELEFFLKTATINTNYSLNNKKINKILSNQLGVELYFILLNFRQKLLLKAGISVSRVEAIYYNRADNRLINASNDIFVNIGFSAEVDFIISQILAVSAKYQRQLDTRVFSDELTLGIYLYKRF